MRYYVRAFFGDSRSVFREHFKYRRDAQKSFDSAKQSALSMILCTVDEDFFYDPDRGKSATIIKKYGHTVLEYGMKIYPKTF